MKLILTDAHEKVRETLAARRQTLEELAQLLLKKEVVERPELQAILKFVSIDRAMEKKKNLNAAEANEGRVKSDLKAFQMHDPIPGCVSSQKRRSQEDGAYMAQALLIGIIMKIKQNKLAGFGLAALLFAALPTALYAYEEIAVKDGATIRGTVKVDGKLPKVAPLQITKYREICKDVPNETLIVGPAQGLRYAVITLEGVAKGKAVEKETVHELDNVKCRFSPHVQAASVGQFVLFKNSDPILHTAHALFTNEQPQFNIGLYPGRVSRKPLVAAGLVKIQCEVHPWMTAYILVSDHPYSAVSDLYGEYEISEIPPGTYQLKVWHESLGTQEKRIEVKSAAAQKVDFTFTPSSGVKK